MILVTGAGGMVGREVARRLLAAGEGLRLFARKAAKVPDDIRKRAELFVGDFTDPSTLAPALRGVELLYLTSFDHPGTVQAQKNAIAAAQAVGVRRVVRLSAPAADPQSPANFARWHGECERLLEASGIESVHLRPNWYMDNFLYEYGVGGLIRLPAGDARVSFIDARDIAAVAVAALLRPGHEGRTYELTGPAALTYTEVAAELSRAGGRPYRFESVPLADYEKDMRARGEAAWWIEEHVDLFRRMLAGENARVTGQVRRITGRAAIPFADFVRDHRDLIRKRA